MRPGARVLTGGNAHRRRGNYYPPTVLTDIPPSPAYREELFGPVAALFRVRSVDEAIAVANDVPFGLGASVWTNDAEERAGSSTSSRPGRCSSTRWWRPIRACRSAA